MPTMEEYIVERLHSLEKELYLKDQLIEELKDTISNNEEIDAEIKAAMQRYFRKNEYIDGKPYIETHWSRNTSDADALIRYFELKSDKEDEEDA